MTDLPGALRPLAFLVGTWRGEGEGLLTAEPRFHFAEEVRYTAPPGKPFLRHEQRTWAVDDGRSPAAVTGG